MKKMRQLPLLLLLAFFAASCSDDENGNQSNCGTSAALTGTWNIEESCGGNLYQNQIIIETSSGGITIRNLGGGGSNSVVTATVSGGTFTIPSQSVQGVTFSGSGSLNSNCTTLTINWVGHKGACSSTGTK